MGTNVDLDSIRAHFSDSTSLKKGYHCHIKDLPIPSGTRLFLSDFLEGHSGLRSTKAILTEINNLLQFKVSANPNFANNEISESFHLDLKRNIDRLQAFFNNFREAYNTDDLHIYMDP